mmetsp:Transcript_9591/g.34237  ORF Transcript_9591/g.34237 Transcript_9591/m.34237 type:complete len:295 (+) Transcript_9591:1786-2670(+)
MTVWSPLPPPPIYLQRPLVRVRDRNSILQAFFRLAVFSFAEDSQSFPKSSPKVFARFFGGEPRGSRAGPQRQPRAAATIIASHHEQHGSAPLFAARCGRAGEGPRRGFREGREAVHGRREAQERAVRGHEERGRSDQETDLGSGGPPSDQSDRGGGAQDPERPRRPDLRRRGQARADDQPGRRRRLGLPVRRVPGVLEEGGGADRLLAAVACGTGVRQDSRGRRVDRGVLLHPAARPRDLPRRREPVLSGLLGVLQLVRVAVPRRGLRRRGGDPREPWALPQVWRVVGPSLPRV